MILHSENTAIIMWLVDHELLDNKSFNAPQVKKNRGVIDNKNLLNILPARELIIAIDEILCTSRKKKIILSHKGPIISRNLFISEGEGASLITSIRKEM